MEGTCLPGLHKAFRLNSRMCAGKMRIMSSGAGKAVKREMPGHWNNDYGNGKNDSQIMHHDKRKEQSIKKSLKIFLAEYLLSFLSLIVQAF